MRAGQSRILNLGHDLQPLRVDHRHPIAPLGGRVDPPVRTDPDPVRFLPDGHVADDLVRRHVDRRDGAAVLVGDKHAPGPRVERDRVRGQPLGRVLLDLGLDGERLRVDHGHLSRLAARVDGVGPAAVGCEAHVVRPVTGGAGRLEWLTDHGTFPGVDAKDEARRLLRPVSDPEFPGAGPERQSMRGVEPLVSAQDDLRLAQVGRVVGVDGALPLVGEPDEPVGQGQPVDLRGLAGHDTLDELWGDRVGHIDDDEAAALGADVEPATGRVEGGQVRRVKGTPEIVRADGTTGGEVDQGERVAVLVDYDADHSRWLLGSGKARAADRSAQREQRDDQGEMKPAIHASFLLLRG